MNSQHRVDGVDELTRQVIDHAYAKYCAEQHMQPSAAAAQRFAVNVTASDAREYHGMRSAALVQMLAREFPPRGAPRKG